VLDKDCKRAKVKAGAPLQGVTTIQVRVEGGLDRAEEGEVFGSGHIFQVDL
jgi:hypothetical protein